MVRSRDQDDDGKRPVRPRQMQADQPGVQSQMFPRPRTEPRLTQGSDRLLDRVALITGGDSGIGQAIAAAFAREGADVAISYLNEDDDAEHTEALVEDQGRDCLLLPGDIQRTAVCEQLVHDTVDQFGRLDILVNNAAVQFPRESILDLHEHDLLATFRTNVFAAFALVRAALPSLRRGTRACIINTVSVTAYRGSKDLLDYSATKGALVAFTRSLALQLVKEGIRVNAVAPGPIWTPLIPASFDPEKVSTFGSDVPMHRAGDPAEVAGAYVFLASDEASFITGQVIHVNGGEIVNG